MNRLRQTFAERHQRLVAALCATYGVFYFGRVNISVVLPLLAVELDASLAQVGILGTVFFWLYALGNFVCGELGSHIRPFRLIGIGLLISAFVNLAFGFQSSLVAMLLLWALNGLAQSGGWSPMIRILAEGLSAAQAKRASTVMPFGYVFGTVITWSVIGIAATAESWRLAFWLPGVVLLLAAALWWRAGIDAPKRPSPGLQPARIISEARSLVFALLATALAGFVRNGSIIWLPAWILSADLVEANLAGAVAALTQVVAILGLLIARQGVMRSNQVFATAVLLFCGAGLAFLLLTRTEGPASIALIAVALMLLNGAFGLTTSSMPLLLAPPGRASSVTGTLNMMATLAGGLAGFSIGFLVERSGWGAVFGLWGALLLLAALLIWRRRADEDRWAGAQA